MSKYTFTVRKKELEISLQTNDKDAIEQQIAIWVMAVSRKPLVETISQKEFCAAPLQPVEEFNSFEQSNLSEDELQVKEFVPEKIDEPMFVENDTKTFEPLNQVLQEEVSTEFNNMEHLSQEQIDQSIELANIDFKESKSEEPSRKEYIEEFINTIQPDNELFSQPEPQIQTAEQSFVEQYSERFQNQEQYTEPHSEKQNELAVTLNSLFKAEAPTTSDFESILEQTVDNLGADTSNVMKKDENFCKLVKANNITDRLDLLLFTADYFCKYDARFSFSLKQINGKLMNNLAVIVDHGILKIALDNNYLEREGESEYRLTEYGRSEIYSKAGIWS